MNNEKKNINVEDFIPSEYNQQKQMLKIRGKALVQKIPEAKTYRIRMDGAMLKLDLKLNPEQDELKWANIKNNKTYKSLKDFGDSDFIIRDEEKKITYNFAGSKSKDLVMVERKRIMFEQAENVEIPISEFFYLAEGSHIPIGNTLKGINAYLYEALHADADNIKTKKDTFCMELPSKADAKYRVMTGSE